VSVVNAAPGSLGRGGFRRVRPQPDVAADDAAPVPCPARDCGEDGRFLVRRAGPPCQRPFELGHVRGVTLPTGAGSDLRAHAARASSLPTGLEACDI
jgi:hypothetical protein